MTDKDVLKKIRIVIKDSDNEEYTRLHFAPFDFIDKNGDLQPAFNLTRNGFMLLVMGFTGKAALPIKISYMQAFDWMAEQLYKMQHGYMEKQNSAWLEYTKEKDKASEAGRNLSCWRHDIKPKLTKRLEQIQSESQISLTLN